MTFSKLLLLYFFQWLFQAWKKNILKFHFFFTVWTLLYIFWNKVTENAEYKKKASPRCSSNLVLPLPGLADDADVLREENTKSGACVISTLRFQLQKRFQTSSEDVDVRGERKNISLRSPCPAGNSSTFSMCGIPRKKINKRWSLQSLFWKAGEVIKDMTRSLISPWGVPGVQPIFLSAG